MFPPDFSSRLVQHDRKARVIYGDSQSKRILFVGDISQPQKSSPQTWLTQLSFSRKESCNQVAQLITATILHRKNLSSWHRPFGLAFIHSTCKNMRPCCKNPASHSCSFGAGDFTLSNESKPKSHAAVNSWEASCRAHRCDGSSGMEDCTGLASVEPRVLAEFRWDNPKAATLSPQHVLLLCSCLPYPLCFLTSLT